MAAIEGCLLLRQIYAWHCIVWSLHYNTVQKRNNKERKQNNEKFNKACIQNCKFVRVCRSTARLKRIKPSQNITDISSTILPSVSSATCQLLTFWHAQKAKFQDNYLIDLKLTLPLYFLFCPLLSIFLPTPPISPCTFSFFWAFGFLWWEKVLQKLLGL